MGRRDIKPVVAWALMFVAFALGPVLFWAPFVLGDSGVWGAALALPWVLGLTVPFALARVFSLARTGLLSLSAAMAGGLAGQLAVWAIVFPQLASGTAPEHWIALAAVDNWGVYWTVAWTLNGVFPIVLALGLMAIRDQFAKRKALEPPTGRGA